MPELAPNETSVLTVWELTRSIRALLEGEIGTVWVEGEVSNHRKQASGHQYFTLKDDRSQVPCVLFRGNANLLSGGVLADGQHVQVYGDLTVYELRGQYQMVVQLVQGKGVGALQARFEALKARLAAEGLFDPARKKPLPAFPSAVGLVTSPTGAALQDMLNILKRRAPWLRIALHPVRVQGSGASAEIAEAVADFNRRGDVDLIVVTRGGGSIEDLWEFNEEIVARVIAASELPVVSAVGHEIDFTIADFAADLRAPTPSAAAELIVPDATELQRQLAAAGQFLERQLRQYIERAHERLQGITPETLLREPQRRIAEARQQQDIAQESLERAVRDGWRTFSARLREQEYSLRASGPAHQIALQNQRISNLADKLGTVLCCEKAKVNSRVQQAQRLIGVLGPQATLERGYSIVIKPSGGILRQTVEARTDDLLTLRLSDGSIQAKVIGG